VIGAARAFAVSHTARRIWLSSELWLAELRSARSAKVAVWLLGAVVVINAVNLLVGTGSDALVDALDALFWPALVGALAFAKQSPARHAAFADLARLRGLDERTAKAAHALSRVRYLARPLLLGALVSWLCWLEPAVGFRGLAAFPLGLAATAISVLLLSACLALLFAASEQLVPSRPVLTLLTLVTVPALLARAVPELPSLMHSFAAWNAWAVSLVERA
jgi:hypothetical protein